MNNSEHGGWLHDDQRIILCTAVSLAALYGGWRQYNNRHEALLRARQLGVTDNAKPDKEHIDRGDVSGASAITSRLMERTLSSVAVEEDVDNEETHSVASTLSKGDTNQPKRSKERRRRGRDVYKDLAKLEKKVKVGKQMPNGKIILVAGSSVGSGPGSTSSRSPSTTRSTLGYDSSIDTPRPLNSARFADVSAGQHRENPVEVSDEPRLPDTAPGPEQEVAQDIAIISPTPHLMASSQPNSTLEYPLSSRQSRSRSRSLRNHLSQPNDTVVVSETPSRPSSSSRSHSSVSSRALSNSINQSPPSSHISPSVTMPIVTSATQTAQLDNLPQSKSHPKSLSVASTASFALSDSSWEYDVHSPSSSSSHRKSPPPRFRSRSRASVSPLPALSSESLMFPSLNPTPPPNANFSTQIASYKGALEAARLREEKYKHDIERYAKECDILRWRWNEDAAMWKRREAELQTHIHNLMHQFHLLSSVAQSPSHMPPFMHQQPLSPHAHGPVFPILTGVPPSSPFGYPPNSGGAGNIPHPFLPQFPGPRSASAASSASPSREGKNQAVGGDSSKGGDVGFNDELAEAILKRPESIRSSTSASASTSGPTSRSASVLGRATRNGFTFASLSELGNPQRVDMDDCEDADVNGEVDLSGGNNGIRHNDEHTHANGGLDNGRSINPHESARQPTPSPSVPAFGGERSVTSGSDGIEKPELNVEIRR